MRSGMMPISGTGIGAGSSSTPTTTNNHPVISQKVLCTIPFRAPSTAVRIRNPYIMASV